MRTERKQHAKNEKKLPSESGNNAAGSFKFLNSLTRQGRQLRMLRGCTRERRKTHGRRTERKTQDARRKTHARRTEHSILAFSFLFRFVGYPVQRVQL